MCSSMPPMGWLPALWRFRPPLLRPTLPATWILAPMHRQNDDFVWLHVEINGIGEALQNHAAHWAHHLLIAEGGCSETL